MSTFQIRYNSIIADRNEDGDTLRFKRQMSRLEIDITKQLRLDNYDNPELEELLDRVWEKLDATVQ